MTSLCPRRGTLVKSTFFGRAGRFLAVGLFVPVFFLACGGGDAEEDSTPREVYDVPPAIEVPIADDPQEPPRPKGLSGRLPAGFPENLPLFLPASLIDYGQDPSQPWIEMLAPADRDRVESEMLGQAAEAGWTVSGGTLNRAGRTVRVEFRDGNPGTIIRVFY